MNAEASLVVSWQDGRTARVGSIKLTAEGIELDEVLDALAAGLAATTDRTYTVEASAIDELVRRRPEALRGPVRSVVPARAARPARPAPSS